MTKGIALTLSNVSKKRVSKVEKFTQIVLNRKYQPFLFGEQKTLTMLKPFLRQV